MRTLPVTRESASSIRLSFLNITTKALALTWHKEQGHRVVIVSGECATKNCFGPEKVSRIKTAYTLSEFEHIYAYADSSGDTELLELADTSGYRIS